MGKDIEICETNTEKLFRSYYGVDTFIEKAAIPKKFKFKSKKGTSFRGYPDFFLDCSEYVIIVEAKPIKHEDAESEVKWYMNENDIKVPKIGIAISGQDLSDMKITYFYKIDNNDICEFDFKNVFKSIEYLGEALDKKRYGDSITDEELTSILTGINNKFHDFNVRDTDRSLLFSALMIALTDNNFRSIYNSLSIYKSKNDSSLVSVEAKNLNDEILKAVNEQLKDKINNLSKEFSWKDRFSFINTIDIPLDDYKTIINNIEKKIYIPFNKGEKKDILGRAYKVFLKRAGKIDNKNIILTPDHIKDLMIKLARLNVEDVVLDTCTGSGGFLMDAMEVLLKLAQGNEDRIKHIQEKQLIGFEIDPVLFSLACSNMFLHGDGKTNMIYRNSLLGSSEEDKKLLKSIKDLKPTKVIINPPYENKNPINFTKQALEFLEPNGKLVIIMPTIAISSSTNKKVLQDIFAMARLDYVIKMPLSIFKEQKRTVYTSIFGFTKTPHQEDDEVLFCNLESDGLVSVQKKGRIDKYNRWNSIETKILDTIKNKKEEIGFSEKRRIITNGEFVLYGVKKDKTSKYDLVKFSDLFNTDEQGSLASEKSNPDGEYDFIAAAKEWKKHDTYDHDQEAIVYVCDSDAPIDGRAHYVNGKFIASNLCRILTPKNIEKYPIDLEFYSYYLMSIRKQLVKDLATGTSKLTLKKEDLDNYIIEYIPLEEQLKLKEVMREKNKRIAELEQKLELEKESLYDNLSDM